MQRPDYKKGGKFKVVCLKGDKMEFNADIGEKGVQAVEIVQYKGESVKDNT